MGRTLYILAAVLGALAVVSGVLSATGVAGSPGDAALWRTMAIWLLLAGLVVALLATMTRLWEQAEHRSEEQRREARRRKE
ncbi:MAG: hypothetical protein PW735_04005 [Acidobacteriaceae bacterium]|nr:hypothetical protein [Acidobacteriaceae bacterium]